MAFSTPRPVPARAGRGETSLGRGRRQPACLGSRRDGVRLPGPRPSGCSSVGRASAWHVEGRGFESRLFGGHAGLPRPSFPDRPTGRTRGSGPRNRQVRILVREPRQGAHPGRCRVRPQPPANRKVTLPRTCPRSPTGRRQRSEGPYSARSNRAEGTGPASPGGRTGLVTRRIRDRGPPVVRHAGVAQWQSNRLAVPRRSRQSATSAYGWKQKAVQVQLLSAPHARVAQRQEAPRSGRGQCAFESRPGYSMGRAQVCSGALQASPARFDTGSIHNGRPVTRGRRRTPARRVRQTRGRASAESSAESVFARQWRRCSAGQSTGLSIRGPRVRIPSSPRWKVGRVGKAAGC